MKTHNISYLYRLNVILFIFLMTCSCELFDLCSGIDCEFKGKISSEDLITVIKYYQDKYVRKSYGTYAYQCFTSDDYTSFCNDRVTEKIRSELQKSKLLDKLVGEIGKLEESERNQLLNKGLTTYQPTWSELGRISEEGQTIAGQRAQKDIAETIVNLVKSHLF